MERETQEYYDKYFTLFGSDGWKQLVDELSNNAAQINSVEATKDTNDLYFRKGQLNVLAYILNMQSIVETNYEEAIKPSEQND